MKKGFYWHCHHDVLAEYCYDYDKRVKFIKENKPANEIEERLRLFQPIKGKLPSALIKAGEACHKAVEAYDKAKEAYDKAKEAYDKAADAYDKAWDAYGKALKDNKAVIEKLHAEECPNCSWDGETLHFNKEK